MPRHALIIFQEFARFAVPVYCVFAKFHGAEFIVFLAHEEWVFRSACFFCHNRIDDDFNGSAGVPVPLDHVLDLCPALRSLASQRIPAISQTVTNVHFPSLTLILLRSIQ